MHAIESQTPRRKSGAMYFLGRPAHVWQDALASSSRRIRRRTERNDQV
jgi:hypothetical protein